MQKSISVTGMLFICSVPINEAVQKVVIPNEMKESQKALLLNINRLLRRNSYQ